jgi:hypothetical protein
MKDKKLIAVITIGTLLLIMNLCCLFFNVNKSLNSDRNAAIADHGIFNNDEFFNAGGEAVLHFIMKNPKGTSQNEFEKYMQSEYLKKIKQGGDR